ncbi:MAG: hypothetical protein QF609_06150 [Gammaproteobacteria bacterium]|jgi:hypothetical protein|nr:hypothetical protein [Gammaproteobacteria bacterium]
MHIDHVRQGASRAVFATMFAVFVAILVPGGSAKAAFVAASDGFGGFKNVFEVTDTVFAFGDMNKIADPGPFGTLLNPTARVYVMTNQAWAGGETLTDITGDGFNNVSGLIGSGFFSDVSLWTAPLAPGLYDIILDENKNGRFDPINDTVMDLGLSGEFLVGGAGVPLPPAILFLASGLLGLMFKPTRRQLQ